MNQLFGGDLIDNHTDFCQICQNRVRESCIFLTEQLIPLSPLLFPTIVLRILFQHGCKFCCRLGLPSFAVSHHQSKPHYVLDIPSIDCSLQRA